MKVGIINTHPVFCYSLNTALQFLRILVSITIAMRNEQKDSACLEILIVSTACGEGLWNYHILLRVHGQLNGQNLFVRLRVTCPKIDIFPISHRKHML